MVRTTSRDTGRPERHQHLAAGAELDDLLPALVAARRSVGSDRIGHPDVAFAIDLDAVGPDEHAASEARHHLAVRAEFVDRVSFRVAAFVAEPGGISERVASDDGPDVTAVGVDCHLSHGAHLAAVRQLGPPVYHAIRVREGLSRHGCIDGRRRAARKRDASPSTTLSTCPNLMAAPRSRRACCFPALDVFCAAQ